MKIMIGHSTTGKLLVFPVSCVFFAACSQALTMDMCDGHKQGLLVPKQSMGSSLDCGHAGFEADDADSRRTCLFEVMVATGLKPKGCPGKKSGQKKT